jgi:hypothetical protein
MLTAVECRSMSEQKLAEAEQNPKHERRLRDAAEARLFLAKKLDAMDRGSPLTRVLTV